MKKKVQLYIDAKQNMVLEIESVFKFIDIIDEHGNNDDIKNTVKISEKILDGNDLPRALRALADKLDKRVNNVKNAK